MRDSLQIDENIRQAVDAWIKYGLEPGSCTTLLLRGEYDAAFRAAHPLIKPFWHDHILYIESLPPECRGEQMEAWSEARRKEHCQSRAADLD